MLLDFGDLVESLGGSYVTAEDVGTGWADMSVIAERTSHVVGLGSDRGGSGDPSPITALGVLAAMRACARERFGSRELNGLRVCVVGLGHVGTNLAELLEGAGAEVVASDIDPARRDEAERRGWAWVDPGEAIASLCDILAPCALGGAIGTAEVAALRCQIVCGAANNVLVDDGAADLLHARGVLYAPDFLANAGGLISVYGELRRFPPERARALALGIEESLGQVLGDARRLGSPPLASARRLAMTRLDRAARVAVA